jgi:hypothetical protein
VFYSAIIAEMSPALQMNFLTLLRHDRANHAAPVPFLILLLTTLPPPATANTMRLSENNEPFG